MEENKTNVTETKQEDKGLSQIQPNEKRSWWSIAFIWVGTMICIPMLMVGGIFGSVLTMSSIFWATLIGFAICCTMMILGGIVGSDTGLNATMCSTRAFGMTGANFTMALVNTVPGNSDRYTPAGQILFSCLYSLLTYI